MNNKTNKNSQDSKVFKKRSDSTCGVIKYLLNTLKTEIWNIRKLPPIGVIF